MTTASLIDALITELKTSLTTTNPEVAGLQALAHLITFSSGTVQDVAAAREAFEKRQKLANAAVEALVALKENGYPETIHPSILPEDLAEIEAIVKAIDAAFAQFESNRAKELGLKAEKPSEKP